MFEKLRMAIKRLTCDHLSGHGPGVICKDCGLVILYRPPGSRYGYVPEVRGQEDCPDCHGAGFYLTNPDWLGQQYVQFCERCDVWPTVGEEV